eukprot:9780552-Prorocentrum_lima.AAC.1
MTSSLVGSEMCIRDRLSTLVRATGCTRSAIACSSISSWEAGRRQAACHPVSYTHLTLPTICSV